MPEVQPTGVRGDVCVRRGALKGVRNLLQVGAEAFHRRLQPEQLPLLVHHGGQGPHAQGVGPGEVPDHQKNDGK